MNWNSVHICLPIQIKKNLQATSDMDANMITVNNCFTHWIKKIDIRRCNVQILLISNTTDLYRYSDAILKHFSL